MDVNKAVLPMILICPAEDPSSKRNLETKRELQIALDMATKLSLPMNHDPATNKLYIGHAKGWSPPKPVPPPRKTNDAGKKIIKEEEGCRLEAYDDGVGVLTIGWGHTGSDVTPGLRITQQRADELFLQDLAKFERGVQDLVKVRVSENQFGALVSFAYNVGLGAFKESTLLRLVNEAKFQAASNEFEKWTNGGDPPKPMGGLIRRRRKERELFLKSSIDGKASVKAKVKPIPQHESDTCGITSCAMAINMLTGKNFTDLSLKAKYGYNLNEALNEESGKHWELPDFTPDSWDLIEESLDKGYPVLFAANGFNFSMSGRGHILLIVEIDGQKVTMADPNGGVFRTWTKDQCNNAPPHPQGKWMGIVVSVAG